jgi:hypothetical protein
MLAASAWAQPTNIRLVRVTHQQVVVEYQMTPGTPCEIKFSKFAALTPVVHDVNGSLFRNIADDASTGHNYDLARPDTFVLGSYRRVVIGKRGMNWGEAIDGYLYSRSLEAFTAGYLSICGVTYPDPIVTRNIPFGPFLDHFPTDPRVSMRDYGYYGYPSLFHLDRTQEINEPWTGALIRKITLPKESHASAPAARTLSYAAAVGTNWTNSTGGSFMTDTGTDDGETTYAFATTQDVLYIPRSDNQTEDNTIRQMTLTIKAWYSTGSGEDLKAQVCLCSGPAPIQWESDWKDAPALTTSITTVIAGDVSGPSDFWTHGKSHIPEGFVAGSLKPNMGFCLRKKTSANNQLNISYVSASANFSEQFGSSTTLPRSCAPSYTTDSTTGTQRWSLCYFADRNSGAGRFYSFNVDTGEAHYIAPLRFLPGNGAPVSGAISVGSVVWTGPRQFYFINSVAASSSRLVRCNFPVTAGLLTTDFTLTLNDSATYFNATNCKDVTPTGTPSYRIDNQVQSLTVNGVTHPHYSSYWQTKNLGAWSLSHAGEDGRLFLYGFGGQATGKWMAVFDPNAAAPAGCSGCEGAIIALTATGVSQGPGGEQAGGDLSQGCKWNTFASVADPDWIGIGCSRQETYSYQYTDVLWGGPYSVIASGIGGVNITASTSDNTFQLTAQTTSGGVSHYDAQDQFASSVDANDDRMILKVGSILHYAASETDTDFGTGTETMEVTAIDDSTTPRKITVRRGADLVNSPYLVNSPFAGSLGFANTVRAITAGSRLYLKPRALGLTLNGGQSIWYWNFGQDPFGLQVVTPPWDAHTKPFPAAVNTPVVNTDFVNYSTPQITAFRLCCDHSRWWSFGDRVVHTSGSNCSQHFGSGEICYAVQTQYPGKMTQINTNATYRVAQIPRFANQFLTAKPSNDTHVKSYQILATGRELKAGIDTRAINDWKQVNQLQTVSTNNYLITEDWIGSNPFATINLGLKWWPTAAYSGSRILRNISGPANCTVTPSAANCVEDAKPHTYSVAINANEAYTGSTGVSQTGAKVYGNLPFRNIATTSAADTNNGFPRTRYAFNAEGRSHTLMYGVTQVDLGSEDIKGEKTRMLAMAYRTPFVATPLDLTFALPDASWTLYLGVSQGVAGWYAIKTPPLPEVGSLDRLTFERVVVDLYHPTAANFQLQFGYVENGTATEYRCSPNRLEECYVNSLTVNESNPFNWASEGATMLACNTGTKRCRAEVPRLPGRVVFMRALLYDGTTNCSGGPCLIETKVLPPQ